MASIAVAGATGQVGRAVVAVLRDGGHQPVEISRATGVDVVAGTGLDRALTGVSAVIDVLNTPAPDAAAAVAFFDTTARNLIQAEQRAGVGHHVLLSIVNVGRFEGNAHYAGKRAQERVVETGPVPWTIQPATQFHGFAGMVAGRATRDGVATVAPLLVRPVAVADVAAVLVELATGAPQGRAPDLAGPSTEDLVDMARRTLAARGDPTRLRASWRDGPYGVAWAGEVLLPDPGARIAPTTFDAWLDRQRHPLDRRVPASDLVLRWFEMCRTGDRARLDELATDAFVGHGPGGSADRAGFLAWLRWYPTAFTDQRTVIEDVIEGGDRIVVRYGTRSTYRGGFLDLPARDQPVRESGIIIFRVAGGRVAETWFQANDLEVAQQLGGRVGPAVVVRAAVAEDLAVLQGVFRRAALANAGDRELLLARPELLMWSGEAIAGGRVRVAVEDGTVAGFATTVPVETGLELEDLFVEPDRMRRGVGRRLIEDVLDTARAEGVAHVWVTANPHAMAFYTAVGFRPDGTAPTLLGPAPRLRLDVPAR